MNKRCVALTREQYERAIELLRNGFILDGHIVKPNNRIATIEVLQATLGLRICDILSLRMTSFVKDGNRYRLDVIEKKTSKDRPFTVPMEVYSFIQGYALENNIPNTAKLFDISERQVERHLNKVFTKMELPLRQYGTHSFRKFFGVEVYNNNGKDIRLVQFLYQHSSPTVTQVYLSIFDESVENALAGTSAHLI